MDEDIEVSSIYVPKDEYSKVCIEEKVVDGLNSDELKSLSLEPPNGGYGWIVVIAVFFVHVFILGNVYSFGVFYPVYIEYYHASPADVAWIGSIGFSMLAGLGAYAGRWADKFGNGLIIFIGGIFVSCGYFLASYSTALWHLYLTHGLLAGFGYCLAFISAVSVVGQWFTTRRGFAVGLAVSGSGLGQFVMSIVTQILIQQEGWRMAIRYLALISIVGLTICSLLIRRFTPTSRGQRVESSYKMFLNWQFSTLYVAALFSSLGMVMPITHLLRYALLHGVSRSNAVLLLSWMGIASAAGRVSLGFAADRAGKLSMLFLCTLGGTVTTFSWLACLDYDSLVAFAVLFGFFAGGLISLMPAVTADLFGVNNLASVIGLLYTSTAVGNLLSAPIGGYLFAVHHNYDLPIVVTGLFMAIATVFLFMVKNPVKDALESLSSHNGVSRHGQEGEGEGEGEMKPQAEEKESVVSESESKFSEKVLSTQSTTTPMKRGEQGLVNPGSVHLEL